MRYSSIFTSVGTKLNHLRVIGLTTMLLLLTTACGLPTRAQPTPTVPPTLTMTPTTVALPTFLQASLPEGGAAVILLPAITPTPVPTAVDPNFTATPTPTELPAYAEVSGAPVILYAGPDTTYPQIGEWQVGRLLINAKTLDGQWVQLCNVTCGETSTYWGQLGGTIETHNLETVDSLVVRTTPTPTPTPYAQDRVVIEAIVPSVTLYEGPGETFPVLAQWYPGIPLAVTGRTLDGTWLQVCCLLIELPDAVSDKAWVPNDTNLIRLTNAEMLSAKTTPIVPEPPPILYPFERAIGPEYSLLEGNGLTILAKIYVGDNQALAGYSIGVEFQETGKGVIERLSNSWRNFEQGQTSVSTLMGETIDSKVLAYNYKFEYNFANGFRPGTWRIWLTNAEQAVLAPPQEFVIDGGNKTRMIYIGWIRVR